MKKMIVVLAMAVLAACGNQPEHDPNVMGSQSEYVTNIKAGQYVKTERLGDNKWYLTTTRATFRVYTSASFTKGQDMVVQTTYDKPATDISAVVQIRILIGGNDWVWVDIKDK